MSRPLGLEAKEHSSIVKVGLFSHFTNKAFCDVTFRCGTLDVEAHKCIVSIFCKNIFTVNSEIDESIDCGKTVIDLTQHLNCSPDDLQNNFKSFLVFLYTGSIDLHVNNVTFFKQIADTFYCDILRNSILNFEAENVEAFKCKTDVERLNKTEIRLNENLCKNQRLKNGNLETRENSKPMDECKQTSIDKVPSNDLGETTDTAKHQDNIVSGLPDSSLKSSAQLKKISPSKEFRCSKCEQTFIHVNKFLKHMDKYDHFDINCSICDFNGESQEDLVVHLECHRTPGKPYHCQICSMKFRSRRELNVHLPKHSDTFVYHCQICGKGFKWKQVLKVHMATHSDTATFLCSLCGFSTKHKSTMETHQNRHVGKDFACTYPGCNFKTARKQNLKQHMKNHNNEASFSCSKCEKSFSQKKNLTRHLAFHEESQLLLKCTVAGCSYANHRKDKLAHHISVKHKETVTPSISQDKLEMNASEEKAETRNMIYQNSSDSNLTFASEGQHSTDDTENVLEVDKRSVPLGKEEVEAQSSGLCLDPMKYVNPPNRTVTQSLASFHTTTPPLDMMTSSINSISNSFLEGFM